MTASESGFCDHECDDCGAEIADDEWHVHNDDDESLCRECCDSDFGWLFDGVGMNQADGETFSRHPRS